MNMLASYIFQIKNIFKCYIHSMAYSYCLPYHYSFIIIVCRDHDGIQGFGQLGGYLLP